VHPGDDVHPLLVADGLERLADVALQRVAREVGLERAPLIVYVPLPGRSVTRAIAVLRLPVAR
jgi:hypothetical protein